jgi:hypothetical protein
MLTTQQTPGFSLVLPGPTRKRTPAAYGYNLAYRNPNTSESGCLATWKVLGGREEYQISLEKTEQNQLLWHCCCADSVYRQNDQKTHYCKHVRGLFQVFETIGTPICRMPPPVS